MFGGVNAWQNGQNKIRAKKFGGWIGFSHITISEDDQVRVANIIISTGMTNRQITKL